MGDQQAHKANQPGKAHRRAAQHRRQGEQGAPGQAGGQAHRLGHLVPQGEQVQLIAQGQGRAGRQNGEQGGQPQHLQRHPRQTPHHKGVGPQGGLWKEDGDCVNGGGQDAADGHTGQHQGDPAGPRPAGQGVHQHTGAQRPREGRRRHRRHGGGQQGGAQNGSQPRPGVDPDDVGPCQRIAQHPLDDDAPHRQGTAAHQGGQHPGQAGIQYDGAAHSLAPAQQGGGYLSQREADRAYAQTQQGGGGGPGQQRQHQKALMPSRRFHTSAPPASDSSRPSGRWAYSGTGPLAAPPPGPPSLR